MSRFLRRFRAGRRCDWRDLAERSRRRRIRVQPRSSGWAALLSRLASHQRALDIVAAGQVDVAVLDCHVLAVELHDHPKLDEQVRIVDTLGPAPIQPVVVRTGLIPGLKRSLRARLLRPILHDSGYLGENTMWETWDCDQGLAPVQGVF